MERELESLTQFLYIAPVGLIQASMDGEILLINAMSANLLLPIAGGDGLTNLFHAFERLAPDLRSMADAFTLPQGMICDDIHLQVSAGVPGGRDAQILSLSLLKLDAMRVMAVLRDVSLSVRRDRALRQSQSWITTILADSGEYALMSLDRDGSVQAWNPAIGRVTGFDARATVGHSFAMFQLPDPTSSSVADRLAIARRDGWSLEDGWYLRADGSRFWGSGLLVPLDGVDAAMLDEVRDKAHDEARDEPSYSLVIRDISHRREAHDALRRSLTCDFLTGLANRRAFFEEAECELQQWRRLMRPFSLVMIDADHFKAVNDRHGHAAGDSTLRHLAERMMEVCRAQDVLARIGGEEFACLLPGTTLEGARLLADRLCHSIAVAPAEVDGLQIPVTVSVGVATITAEVDGVDELLRRADAALYAAKAAGRNRVLCWTPIPLDPLPPVSRVDG